MGTSQRISHRHAAPLCPHRSSEKSNIACPINIERLPSYQKGFEKGQQRKAVEIAQKLLAMHLSLEQIAAITQLSLAQIATLKK